MDRENVIKPLLSGMYSINVYLLYFLKLIGTSVIYSCQ